MDSRGAQSTHRSGKLNKSMQRHCLQEALMMMEPQMGEGVWDRSRTHLGAGGRDVTRVSRDMSGVLRRPVLQGPEAHWKGAREVRRCLHLLRHWQRRRCIAAIH